jgi:hypothetical protein
MTRTLASLIGAVAATSLLAGASSAAAEIHPAGALGSGYTALDAPLGAPTELRIDLRGRVAARCELVAAPAPMSGLAVTRGGESASAFAIDCNAPFIMRVRSDRGGFGNATPTPGIEPLIPYELSVAVGTDSGRQDLGWCEAAQLTSDSAGACAFSPAAASRGWSSGDATAIDETGTLRLRWRDNASEAPLLGDYQDTITIELEVRS